MVDMNIGDRLKTLREAAGIDQVQAAKIAGTTKQAVSQIENGRTKVPGGMYLYRWAKHYVVDLEWIITGKGEKKLPSQPLRLDAETIAEAVYLAKKSAKLTNLDLLNVEKDPETFAQALRAVIAANLGRNGESDEPARGVGQASGIDSGTSEAKNGAKARTSADRKKRSA